MENDESPTGADAGHRLLVVCTANVCRSPLAARRFADGLSGPSSLGRVVVTSAGTRADAGRPMCPVSADQLPSTPEDDAFAEAHRSSPVTQQAIRDADLVLAMEREQRSTLAQLAPGSQAKVFTLAEVEGLLGVLTERHGPPPGDLVELARALHSVRGYVATAAQVPVKRRWFSRREEPRDPLTIIDGHGLDDGRHEEAVIAVRSTTDRVVAAILALAEPRPASAGTDAP